LNLYGRFCFVAGSIPKGISYLALSSRIALVVAVLQATTMSLQFISVANQYFLMQLQFFFRFWPWHAFLLSARYMVFSLEDGESLPY
jgi:hypothetical protein